MSVTLRTPLLEKLKAPSALSWPRCGQPPHAAAEGHQCLRLQPNGKPQVAPSRPANRCAQQVHNLSTSAPALRLLDLPHGYRNPTLMCLPDWFVIHSVKIKQWRETERDLWLVLGWSNIVVLLR